MLLLDIILVNVVVVLVHSLNKAERRGEERSVFIAIACVLVGSLKGFVLIDWIQLRKR